MSIDRLLRVVPLRLRSLFRRSDVERELDEELEYHIEQQTADNIRRGMSPDDARAAAIRAIGGVAYRKEEVRDTRGTRWIEELAGDLRFALRSLGRARAFTATVVLTLALGIGANTAMFTLLRGTLLRGLPNRDGDRLVYLRQTAPGSQVHNVNFSVPEIGDIRAGSTTLAAIADYSSAVPFTLVAGDGRTVRARVGVVSGNFFDVMGLSPVLGRAITRADDGAAAAPVAVLSFAYWNEHFGRDPKVIGLTLKLNDRAATVVGVAQPAPGYPEPLDLFVNLVASPHNLSAAMVTNRSHRMSEVFARLAPGATVEQARAEIDRISSAMFIDHPDAYEKAAHYQIVLEPLRQAVNERASLTFWLLMGAATFVLLIACANVANLTLMRGVGREREMLVRAALGAGTARLRRLLLAENLALALAGGVIGVGVAVAGLELLVAFAAQFTPRASEIRVDGMVLAVGLATSLLAAVALSFVPRVGGEGTLASWLVATGGGGRRATLGRGRQRVQGSLVVAQVAVCAVLLTGAGLLIRTLGKLQAVDAGVRVEHVLTMDLPVTGDVLREFMRQAENLQRYQQIRDRVAALPGVDAASMASVEPLRMAMMSLELKVEARPTPPNEPTPRAGLKTVDPSYFGAAGIPIVAGRGFQSTDVRGASPVVILNESFAKRLFGNGNPVGRRIAWTGEGLKLSPFTADWRTVIGVVGDTRDRGLDADPPATAYLPFAQEIVINGALVVRTSSDPATVQASVIRAVHDLFPRQLIEHVATLEQIRDEGVAPRRLNAMFIASFGGLAFVIAMVGIAGVLAFSVSSRTNEIGIRMSLGADAGRVRRMVLGEGGLLLGVGLVVGLTVALFAARLLRAMLFGVTPHDPFTLGGVAFVLAAVGLAACWLPAARAARVEPAVALRAE
ncbi:MAG TPA: ABC transporter permease [Gemmatimonadaceae bacterium]|nr:ABC transporter permease [Gemmatimonadaceae bacterium]